MARSSRVRQGVRDKSPKVVILLSTSKKPVYSTGKKIGDYHLFCGDFLSMTQMMDYAKQPFTGKVMLVHGILATGAVSSGLTFIALVRLVYGLSGWKKAAK